MRGWRRCGGGKISGAADVVIGWRVAGRWIRVLCYVIKAPVRDSRRLRNRSTLSLIQSVALNLNTEKWRCGYESDWDGNSCCSSIITVRSKLQCVIIQDTFSRHANR